MAVLLQRVVGGTIKDISIVDREPDERETYRMLAEAQVSSLVRMMFKAEAEVARARTAN